jgi:hypothetical protein
MGTAYLNQEARSSVWVPQPISVTNEIVKIAVVVVRRMENEGAMGDCVVLLRRSRARIFVRSVPSSIPT